MAIIRIFILTIQVLSSFSGKDLLIFIGKADTQRGETERKIFCSLIQSPSDCKGLCGADPKPGSQSHCISHMGAGSQGFGLSSNAFPGQRQGVEWEAGLSGEKQAPIWYCNPCKRILAARALTWAS